MYHASPSSLRKAIRSGEFTTPTSGQCFGYLQTNVVILESHLSDAFEAFCKANRQACPLVAKYEPGAKSGPIAPESDITTDIPKYRIYRQGELVEEVTDITSVWKENLVTFLLGCSFSFEAALQNAGIPVRNIDQKRNVTMFKTNKDCISSGPFSCPLVVSYRPVHKDKVDMAVRITEECGMAHGPPVHIGDPAELGILDLQKPDFGDPVDMYQDEVPLFWACGVTSTLAAISAIITHAPGHMFVTDSLEISREEEK